MTWTPTLEGRIERRVLVNYRVDPERIGVLLPAPFRPNVPVEWHPLAPMLDSDARESRPGVLQGI